MKYWMIGFLLSLTLLPVTSQVLATDSDAVKEVYWEDLQPKHYQASPTASVDHNVTNLAELQPDLNAPVVAELNQQTVLLPGFVVPLDGDAEKITEFLLVPYFGACIHVPPPPPNQIVHVSFPQGLVLNNLQEAIQVTGVITTEGWQGELARVGYKMKATKVEPFTL